MRPISALDQKHVRGHLPKLWPHAGDALKCLLWSNLHPGQCLEMDSGVRMWNRGRRN